MSESPYPLDSLTNDLKAGARRRPILLLIDVEPDARAVLERSSGGWGASAAALDHLARLRGELERATGEAVRFNWFIRADPQIAVTWGRADWVVEACPGFVRIVERTGDHCGIHVHLWRWSAERKAWYNDFHDPDWTDECVDTSVSAFRSIFGKAPESNRFGDRWMSDHGLAVLRRGGIRYDFTIEPDLPRVPIPDDPHATGWLPDFRGAPRQPYVASSTDYLKPAPATGANDLWMLPLTTTKRAWRLVRRAPYVVRGSRSPNLSLDHSYVWQHIKRELDRPTPTPLVVVFRSGDLARRSFLRNFLSTTHDLARHPALPFCEFTGPAEAVSRWLASRQ